MWKFPELPANFVQLLAIVAITTKCTELYEVHTITLRPWRTQALTYLSPLGTSPAKLIDNVTSS